MSPVNPKSNQSVTDKLAGLPEKVTDLSFEELRQASTVFYSSRYNHMLGEVYDELKAGTPLNKHGIEIMELIIAEYSIQYKSPLAQQMSEEKENV